MFAAGGVLIAGMLVFLAIEVNRGSSGAADDGKRAAGDPERRSAAAQRSAPAPRPDRSESDDEGSGPLRVPRPADVAGPQPSEGIAAARLGGRAAGASMAPAPASSNGSPEQDERTRDIESPLEQLINDARVSFGGNGRPGVLSATARGGGQRAPRQVEQRRRGDSGRGSPLAERSNVEFRRLSDG